MSISTPLFEGTLVRLGPIDHEKDLEVVSRWTHDAGFMRMMYTDPMHPLSPWEVKKDLEKLEKSLEEERNQFHFRMRYRQADRRQGYGAETLGLLLYYAFTELNLYRLSALIPAYNLPALALFQAFGFREEVCRRQALERDCQFWDLLNYGILAEEWKERHP